MADQTTIEKPKPWERFAKAPPVAPTDAKQKPWERFSAKPPTPPKPAAVSTAPSITPPKEPGALDALGMSVAKSFGFDPQKILEAHKGKDIEGIAGKHHLEGAAAQWMEAGEQFSDNIRRFGLSVLKDPFNIVKGLEAPGHVLASGIESAGKTLTETPVGSPSFKKELVESGGQILGGLAQALGGAEGVERVRNYSKIVDGPVKAAAEIAAKTGKNVVEATTTAHRIAKHPVINSIMRARVVEDAYEDTVGIDIGNKFDKAVKSAEDEVKAHVEHLGTNIPEKVDAANEAATIRKEFADVVKTPDRYHPSLAQMIQDSRPDPKNPIPKMWSWDKTRQFRSSVGRAINKTTGPQKVVLTRVYIDLTKKLRDPAKAHGLEASFDHYNELEKKIHSTFSDLIDDIRGNPRGAEVGKALNKDSSYTSRALASLSKYGLNAVEVSKYAKNVARIQRLRGRSFSTIFRWAYGNPVGAAVTIGARVGGAPYIGAMGAGAVLGITATYLTRTARALRLAPDVLAGLLEKEKWPGKMELKKAIEPPKVATPPPALPPPTPPSAPPGAPTLSPLAQALEASRTRGRVKELPPTPPPKGLPEPKVEAKAEVAKEPEVKKVAPEEHGTGKLAKQAKARERVARVRKVKGPTALGGGGQEVSGGGLADEALKAQEAEVARQKAAAPHLDVEQFSIPEMEEYIRTASKEDWNMLQEVRKEKKLTDQEYISGLRYLTTEIMERQGLK